MVVLNPSLAMRAAGMWDIQGLTHAWKSTAKCEVGMFSCDETVTLRDGKRGGCYYAWDVNYIAFGWLNSLCGNTKSDMLSRIGLYKSLKVMYGVFTGTQVGDPVKAVQFAEMGRQGFPIFYQPFPSANTCYKNCTACEEEVGGDLDSRWPLKGIDPIPNLNGLNNPVIPWPTGGLF
jgi:hypothetical protein